MHGWWDQWRVSYIEVQTEISVREPTRTGASDTDDIYEGNQRANKWDRRGKEKIEMKKKIG